MHLNGLENGAISLYSHEDNEFRNTGSIQLFCFLHVTPSHTTPREAGVHLKSITGVTNHFGQPENCGFDNINHRFRFLFLHGTSSQFNHKDPRDVHRKHREYYYPYLRFRKLGIDIKTGSSFIVCAFPPAPPLWCYECT